MIVGLGVVRRKLSHFLICFMFRQRTAHRPSYHSHLGFHEEFSFSLQSAVNALVTSRLDYCNLLLHNIPLSQTARLQLVQNNAAWIITRTSKHDHITTVLKELHWLPVESRIAFKTLVMTFKCISGLASFYLAELVQPRKRDGRLCQNCAPTLH